jgi:hypothetical protein
VVNTELTVRQLRWILAHAANDASIGEALSEFADSSPGAQVERISVLPEL